MDWQASPTLPNHLRSECQTRWGRLFSTHTRKKILYPEFFFFLNSILFLVLFFLSVVSGIALGQSDLYRAWHGIPKYSMYYVTSTLDLDWLEVPRGPRAYFFQESQEAMDRKVWNLMTLLTHMSSNYRITFQTSLKSQMTWIRYGKNVIVIKQTLAQSRNNNNECNWNASAMDNGGKNGTLSFLGDVENPVL